MRWRFCQFVMAAALLAACPFFGAGSQARGEYVSVQSLSRKVATATAADPFQDLTSWHDADTGMGEPAPQSSSNKSEPQSPLSDLLLSHRFPVPQALGQSGGMTPPGAGSSHGPTGQQVSLDSKPEVPPTEMVLWLRPGDPGFPPQPPVLDLFRPPRAAGRA